MSAQCLRALTSLKYIPIDKCRDLNQAKLSHSLWQLGAILLPTYGRRLAALTRITFLASSRENSLSLSLSLAKPFQN